MAHASYNLLRAQMKEITNQAKPGVSGSTQTSPAGREPVVLQALLHAKVHADLSELILQTPQANHGSSSHPFTLCLPRWPWCQCQKLEKAGLGDFRAVMMSELPWNAMTKLSQV